MSSDYLHASICFVISLSVTGVSITFSPATVTLGSSLNQNFSIFCAVDNNPSLGADDFILKLALKKAGLDMAWFSVNLNGGTASNVQTGNGVFTGAVFSKSYDPNNKGSASLTMNTMMSNVQCTDAVEYGCFLQYYLYNNGDIFTDSINSTRNLTVTGKVHLIIFTHLH